MRIYKVKDYGEMSRKAANIISAQVILKPDCVLGLATGSTPVGTYRQLVEWYEKGDLDFQRCVLSTWTSTRDCPEKMTRVTITSCMRTCLIR